MGPLKLRSFFKTKDTVNKTKMAAYIKRNILTNPTYDRVLTSKLNKELKKLDIKILNNQLKWGIVLKR